ncbi:MAG: hypothetical protein GKS06_05370 [Acidobacteria bacterium]|nr:hypothetical protein [Acidobacteriota bacterium]
MSSKLRTFVAVVTVFTAVALLATTLGWLSLRNAGHDVGFGALLAAQLLSWHLWTMATPLIARLGQRWRPHAETYTWIAPHLCAAIGLSIARTLIELLYLIPSEGLSITPATLWLGLRGNLPFGLLLDLTVYAVILAFGHVFAAADGRTGSSGDESPAPLDRIPVRDHGRTVFVDVETIDWVEAADYYACLHAAGARYLVRESLAKLEKQLAPRQFLRVHRSAIVNLRRVASLRPHGRGDAVATLADGTTVKVSRTNVASLRAAMGGPDALSSES